MTYLLNTVSRMKPSQAIKQYLSFSRGEQRGVIILGLILLSINLFRWFLPNVRHPDPVDFSAFRMEITRFEEEMNHAKATSGKYRSGKSYAGIPLSGGRKDSSLTKKNYGEPAFILDLNHADTLDLQRLRGIGPSFARRITGYRNRLGGFVSVGQLLEVYGFDSARYEGIRSHLRVDGAAIRQMNLNTLSFKELIAHPYMPYELAKEIALYRKRHKGIYSLDELKEMKSYDSVAFLRLRPYLCVE